MLVRHNGSRRFTKQISSDVNRTVGSSELKDSTTVKGVRRTRGCVRCHIPDQNECFYFFAFVPWQSCVLLLKRSDVLKEMDKQLRNEQCHITQPNQLAARMLCLTCTGWSRNPSCRLAAARSQHANCTSRHATVLHISATQTNWLQSVIGFPGQ